MDGVQSSSQNGSSGVAPTRTFDVSQEAEVVQLLNFIRRGPFSPEDKNSYRDIVLDYAAEKNAASLHTLAQTLIQHGVDLTTGGLSLTTAAPATSEHVTEPVPDSAETEVETAAAVMPDVPHAEVPEAIASVPPQNSFGGARPQPQFGTFSQSAPVAAVPSAPAVAVPPVPDVEHVAVPHEQSEAVVPPVVDSGVVKPLEVTPSDVALPEQVSETVPPLETPEIQEEVAVPPPVQQPESEPLAVETPSSQQATDAPTPVKPPIERIKEIKRRVNDAVGNPVHLIDANNEIGREYMNALLNAMKQVSDGTGADMGLAMDRLEKAYASVMRLLVEHPIGQKQEEKISDDSVSLQDAVSGTASMTMTSPTPAAPEPTAVVESEPVPVSEPEPIPTPVEEAVPTPLQQTEEVSMPSANIAVTDMHEASDAVQEVPLATSTQQESVVPPVPALTESPMTTIPEKIPTIAAPSPEVAAQPQSLAAQLEAERNAQSALTQENVAKQQINTASTDPLLAPEVSSGLHQLLSEWKLFKSSGFLGTGPSGFEHPLYKKMAAMQMESIVAGRFDGATPEVRQSISDYMNGWYYEQNVAHDMNETFEHYLRRIVKRILSKQQAGASAAGAGRA